MELSYKNLEMMQSGPDKSRCAAHFDLSFDIKNLFPYLNSCIEDSIYYSKPEYLKFTYKKYLCYLHPESGTCGPFYSDEEVNKILAEIMEMLSEIHIKRKEIKPDFRSCKPIPVMDIYKVLPGTNCSDCGFSTCIAFAASVSIGDSEPSQCDYIVNPIEESAVYPVFDKDGNITEKIKIDTNSTNLNDEIKKLRKRVNELEGTRPLKSEQKEMRTELTPRETEVLIQVSKGLTNNEIAEKLSISPHTVKSHIIHIFNRLGVSDRTSAAVWAAKNGIV